MRRNERRKDRGIIFHMKREEWFGAVKKLCCLICFRKVVGYRETSSQTVGSWWLLCYRLCCLRLLNDSQFTIHYSHLTNENNLDTEKQQKKLKNEMQIFWIILPIVHGWKSTVLLWPLISIPFLFQSKNYSI